MTPMSYQALFPIADALQLDLFIGMDGEVKGSRVQTLKIAGWDIHTVNHCGDDFVQDLSAGVFIKIRKALWLYMLTYRKQMWAVVFDGKKVGIHQFQIDHFATRNAVSTLTKIGPGIVKCFAFADDKWGPCEVKDIIESGVADEIGDMDDGAVGGGVSGIGFGNEAQP